MHGDSGPTERRRGRPAVVALALVALLGSCGDSRDSSQGDETVPRVEPTAAPTTASTTTPTTTTTTVGPTSPPTPAPAPFPTPATAPPTTTMPPVTQPPVTQPPVTQPPVTQPPAIQTLTTPPPITVPATAPAPPTTVIVTAAEPPLCTDAAVGAATGLLTLTDVTCQAGWAIGHDASCPAVQPCDGVDVFHVTSSGWVHDGYFPARCADTLAGAGMSIYTAARFVPNFCDGDPGPTEIIRPDSTGERVVHVQTALIALGYPIVADGTYGPRTQAAVRDFQSLHDLEVDGIAGPRTQAALGIGPGSGPASTTTPAPATFPPATTIPGTVAPSLPTASTTAPTTTVAGPGDAAQCTAAALAAGIGRDVDEVVACHAGWALGQIRSCPDNSACPRADLFRMTEAGWAFIRPVRYECAEDLRDAGMSAYTAGDFAAWCGVPNLPDVRLVIDPGSTGPIVEQLQVALVALGYPIAIDGTYGPGTEQAVRDFQERNGLEVDGIAGPATREALGL